LPGHALGSLDAAERARVETHVAGCAECAETLAQYRAVVGTLPFALTPETPPAEAWSEIAARVRRAPVRIAVRGRREPLFARLRPLRWPAVAALVAGLLLWNMQLQREVARLRTPALDVEQLARIPGRIVSLAGTGTPGATGRLYVSADGQRGSLALVGLPSLPPDRVYQLWFARPGQPTVTGGAFRVNARGQTVAAVIIPAPLDEVRAIAVTEEPAPASPSPTGKHLLDAQPWR
jgi:anti-sigma-K factor RskA